MYRPDNRISAAIREEQARNAGREAATGTNAARNTAAVLSRADAIASGQNPCSDGIYTPEEVRIEFIIPEAIESGTDDVDPIFAFPETAQSFLAPVENITFPSTGISRTKTLVNQGIFYSLNRDERIEVLEHLSNNGLSKLGYSAELYSVGLAGPNRMSPYGMLYPHSFADYTNAGNFILYPAHSNYANRESSDTSVMIDTLRFVMRRGWTRHQDGLPAFQDTRGTTSKEVPFSFMLSSVMPDMEGNASAILQLHPKKHSFDSVMRNMVSLPLLFKDDGVTLVPPADSNLNIWNPHKTSMLQLYVLGRSHIKYENLGIVEKQMYSEPLVPMGRKFVDITHDTRMPFHKEEVQHLPPIRHLNVSLKVGSNYISDKYRNSTKSSMSYPSAHCMHMIEAGMRNPASRASGYKVLFTSDNVSKFEDVFASQKFKFPMYVNLRLTTNQGTTIAGIIKESKFDNEILDLISSHQSIRHSESPVYAEVLDELINPGVFSTRALAPPDTSLNDITHQGQSRRTIDVLDWVNSMAYAPADDDSSYPLGISDLSLENATPQERLFTRELYKTVFSSKLKEFCYPRVRSYEDIMKGTKAYSETIAYKIEKYSILEDDTRRLDQTFYIIDNDDIDNINFLDTQVKYRQRYEYEIFAFNLVIGTEYEYTCIDTQFPLRNEGASAILQSHYFYFAGRPLREKPTFESGWAFADDFQPVTVFQSAFMGKTSIEHTLILDGDQQTRDTWLRSARENKEPFIQNNPVMKWTGEVSWGAMKGEIPSEQEVQGEFDRRQSAARQASMAAASVRLAEDLHVIQTAEDILDVRYLPEVIQGIPTNSTFGEGADVSPIYVSILTKPKIVLVEVPFFSQQVVMEDAPPVFPQVHFVPYKGNTSTVRINLSANIGEYDLVPVIFNSSDALMVEDVRSAQDARGETIKYKTDNPPSNFLIYRMESPPRDIMDFASEARVDSTSTQGGSASSYDDYVIPNKKYYYTFRAADPSGKLSTPTEVFCCQLVSTENGMYLDVHEYDMKIKPLATSTSFVRSLYINPAEIQRMFESQSNQGTAGDEPLPTPSSGEPSLGLFEHRIWNKRYKIRVKSKKTGRKVDLNIKFKKTMVDYTEGVTVEPSGEATTAASNAAARAPASLIPAAEASEGSISARDPRRDKDYESEKEIFVRNRRNRD